MSALPAESAAPLPPVPVPADLKIDDKILGPFTARQCAIIGIGLAAAWAVVQALAGFTRPSLLAVVLAAAPPVVVALVLALARPGGVPADRLAAAAFSHVRSPRRRAAASPGAALPPGVSRLAAIYKGIHSTEGGAGVVELAHGHGQSAVLIETEPVCLHLTDSHEARAKLAAIGQVLAAQTGPFALYALAERVSLDAFAERAAARAATLGSPQLATFATAQADQFRQLADDRLNWRRRFLIAVSESGTDAQATAVHRAETTAVLLDACGLAARVLDDEEATAAITAACDPARIVAPTRLAAPARIVLGPVKAETVTEC
ncbi:PrgI family protein [Actinospica robiniae]|uniref:PrgI family protein n=1 Tax=Actinospica robiniae TaxID=304901 RepID=UPI00041CF775|nr:PrgI family protein [Actinospica robiniae]